MTQPYVFQWGRVMWTKFENFGFDLGGGDPWVGGVGGRGGGGEGGQPTTHTDTGSCAEPRRGRLACVVTNFDLKNRSRSQLFSPKACWEAMAASCSHQNNAFQMTFWRGFSGWILFNCSTHTSKVLFFYFRMWFGLYVVRSLPLNWTNKIACRAVVQGGFGETLTSVHRHFGQQVSLSVLFREFKKTLTWSQYC